MRYPVSAFTRMARELEGKSLEALPIVLLDNVLLREDHLGFSPCVTKLLTNLGRFASLGLWGQSTSLPSESVTHDTSAIIALIIITES